MGFLFELVVPLKGTDVSPQKNLTLMHCMFVKLLGGEGEIEMIETLMTSKMRAKVLRHFLINMDNRYYLRELERMLGESLSPLRRQLLKLVDMGILVIEKEANLKYYRLNKGFAGLEDLRRLALGKEKPTVNSGKRMRYDIAVLTLVSIFVLVASTFVVYISSKNVTQVASLISEERLSTHSPIASSLEQQRVEGTMVSKRWKVLTGNFPVLSEL